MMRAVWFMILPGLLFLLAALRDLLMPGAFPSRATQHEDALITFAAALFLFIGAYVFSKAGARADWVSVPVTLVIGLAFPLLIQTDWTFPVWGAACLILAGGAIYRSFRRS